MARRWFGFRDVGTCGIVPPLDTSLEFDFPLNITEINDGDTLVRTLFGWRVETVLEDNSGGLQAGVTPAFVALAYLPDPDGEPEGGAESPGGAFLWRDLVTWEAQSWTDGSLFATKWYAQSYGIKSSNVGRIIQDKTAATLQVSFGYDLAMPHSPGGFTITPEVNIMLWVEALVLLR